VPTSKNYWKRRAKKTTLKKIERVMNKSVASIIPERLREAREARGLTVQMLADKLEISRQAVAQFEVGQAEPSPATMSKIIGLLNQPPAFFTTPPSQSRVTTATIFWRSLQRMRKYERDKIARRLNWLQDVLGYLEEFIELPPVNLPAPDYLPKDMDAIEDAAGLVRKIWKLGFGPIPDLVGLLEANGIAVVREHVDTQDMDAVSCWQRGRPIVFLSADKQSSVRSRFDAAHELGHLVLHSGVEVDSRNLAQLEAEANRFAGAFLLPAESFPKEVMSTSIDHFIPLKRRWKVAIAAMIYRCKDLGVFNANNVQYLWRQRAARNWGRKEPLDNEIAIEAPKFLRHAARMILDSKLQSRQDFQDRLLLNYQDIESLCGLEPGTLNTTIIPLPMRPRPEVSRIA
jgi:Zn-dependent peptidase ImmA (M78 family)/DNA-binding XRE family transcriptional regulator